MQLVSHRLPKGLSGRSTLRADRIRGLPRARGKGPHNKGSWFLQPVQLSVFRGSGITSMGLSVCLPEMTFRPRQPFESPLERNVRYPI
jgi:hypothetical protein